MSRRATKRGSNSPPPTLTEETDVEFVSDQEVANSSYLYMFGGDSDGGYESNASNISAITIIPESKQKKDEDGMFYT